MKGQKRERTLGVVTPAVVEKLIEIARTCTDLEIPPAGTRDEDHLFYNLQAALNEGFREVRKER